MRSWRRSRLRHNKSVETEKKVREVAKKAEKVEKKALKDRVEFGGEVRFRIMIENATTDKDFYGTGNEQRSGMER